MSTLPQEELGDVALAGADVTTKEAALAAIKDLAVLVRVATKSAEVKIAERALRSISLSQKAVDPIMEILRGTPHPTVRSAAATKLGDLACRAYSNHWFKEPKVLQLLDSGADPNVIDDNWTLLSLAALRGDGIFLNELLSRGADPKVRGKNGGSIEKALATSSFHLLPVLTGRVTKEIFYEECKGGDFHYAMALGRPDAEVVATLEDPSKPNGCHYPPLMWAAGLNRVSIMEELLQRGADVNASADWPGDGNALHAATSSGHPAACDWLIGHGANIDRPVGFQKLTPAMVAARRGDVHVLEVLCKARANIGLGDREGATPLALAVEWGHVAAADFLIGAGADPAAGGLALLFACATSAPSLLKRIVGQVGVAIDSPDGANAFTALMSAARAGSCESARILIQEGANVNATSRPNTEAFLEHGTIGNAIVYGSVTPLILATMEGHFPMVELLLQRGADVNKGGYRVFSDSSREEFSALSWAIKLGHAQVAESLRKHGARR